VLLLPDRRQNQEREIPMEEIWQRFVTNILGRLDGPLHFRLIAQPLIVFIFAFLDGRKDAKAGNPFYLLMLVTKPKQRRGLLKDGWKHFGKVFIIAIILDLVYQIIVNHMVYPMETLFVVLAIVIVPYVLLRGVVNRIVCLFGKGKRDLE
jgi:hypothetical protein